MSKEIDELISKASVAITNGIQQEPIAALLLQFGYTPERLAVGEGLLNTTEELNRLQIKEDGEQKEATSVLNQSIKKANTVYVPHLKIARIAFKNDTNLSTQLELRGERKQRQSAWLQQTKVFYNNLLGNPDALEKMAAYGQSNEKLEAGLQLVKAVDAQLAVRKKEMGEAQNATETRDAAADELQEWYSDYIEIARIALADQPQYLEMLGIISPS
ncbi:hypothetical protein [Saccharicrinis aurantiacus]|uniref:hypothetical protein n=1 Tax=Saccharicrinis aurantiacus TaxID=1849719 RepID=UPI0008389A46|nr:hypothetical protein [Saccharicrinis aurantiacus]